MPEIVVNQTITDWRAICIADGSTDKSGKILDEFVKKDERFCVYHIENRGLAATRMEGLTEILHCQLRSDKVMENSIAIVIPIYNAEKTLKRCLNSIRKQVFTDWQAVLVDDGSSDRSGTICDAFAAKDARFHCIHQSNSGAVAARKSGVLSQTAQSCNYITFCDADDTMPPNALRILWQTAAENRADLVCGKVQQVWKSIRRKHRIQSPCFQITEPKLYDHQQILDELYASCFGISNLPVSLFAKLYATDLLTSQIDFNPVVKFMGEDLSVVVRVLPVARRLVIIPNTVYYYSLGGGTSRYMPYMMEDFLKLYRYKREYAIKFPMPQDTERLMAIELINMTKTHFLQCRKASQVSDREFRAIVKDICAVTEVRTAAEIAIHGNYSCPDYAQDILNGNTEKIVYGITEIAKKNRLKDTMKSILYRL